MNNIFYNKPIFANQNNSDFIFKNGRIDVDGIFEIDGKKYQFLKEIGDPTKPCDYSYYCKYMDKKILNNRYNSYSNSTHSFSS
jgi:hypothetical protein